VSAAVERHLVDPGTVAEAHPGDSIQIIAAVGGGFCAGYDYEGEWAECMHDPHTTRQLALSCAESRLRYDLLAEVSR
jgi:hypothetical protein